MVPTGLVAMWEFPRRRGAPPCGTVLEQGRPPNEIPTITGDRSPGPLVSLRDKEPNLDGSPRPAFSAAGATLITAGSGLVLVTVGKAGRSPALDKTRASLSLSPAFPVGPLASHQPAQADVATQFLFPRQPPQSTACAHLRRRAGKRRSSTRCGPATGNEPIGVQSTCRSTCRDCAGTRECEPGEQTPTRVASQRGAASPRARESSSCSAVPLVHSRSGTASSSGVPSIFESRPPASRTSNTPAAMSHGFRLVDQ